MNLWREKLITSADFTKLIREKLNFYKKSLKKKSFGYISKN